MNAGLDGGDDAASDSGSSDDSDGEGHAPRRGIFAKPKAPTRARTQQQQQQQQQGQEAQDAAAGSSGGGRNPVVAFDYDAGERRQRKRSDAASQAREEAGRGAGRGARGKGGKGGKQAGRGRAKVVWSPYDVPEGNLMRGGKRSTLTPSSGNRTQTFK